MRRPILLLLSLALLLGLGGCMPYVRQTPEEETTLITVGFSQVGAESDWRVANTESMRESLSEENGFELLFDNARQKQENQFKAIRTFIQQDVDYIAAQLNGDFTQAKAYEETIAYLQSNPAPDVVYCENDNMCFGVMQALDELGIAYGDGGVTLISFDAGRTALSYCKDGKIDLCAECNPLHGPRVRALIEQLARGETPEKLSYMPEALFTADTLTAEFLESRVY